MATACHVVLVSDLEVRWTYNGSHDSTICSTYGIDAWVVSVDRGGIVRTKEFTCGTNWDTGYVFNGIEEGYYSITLAAYQAGDDQPIFSKTTSNYFVSADVSLNRVDFNVTDDDFGGSGAGVLNVYWNINGSTNGDKTGPSWDSCTEVSAKSAVVTIDGVAETYDCDASGNMAVALDVNGMPSSISIKLVDASGQDLTSATEALPPDPVPGKTNTWEYVGAFYPDSFYNKNILGTYSFKVSYENGKSCNAVNPKIGYQYSMLKLDDSLVQGAQVCGPGGNYTDCVAADGADSSVCYDSSTTQKIKNQIWGNYKLTIKGAEAVDEHQCWMKEFDILIGAGTENPVESLDVPKDPNSADAYCQSI